MPDDAPSELLSRRHQMFPVLSEAETARMVRFGTMQVHPRSIRLVTAGQPSPACPSCSRARWRSASATAWGTLRPSCNRVAAISWARWEPCRASPRWSTASRRTPDQAFALDEQLYRRLGRRFASALALWRADDDVHMVMIATFTACWALRPGR